MRENAPRPPASAPGSHPAARLRATIEALAGATLSGRFEVAAGATADAAETDLFPSEIEIHAGASARRRATFSAGRARARSAIVELGWPPVAILAEASGAPIWPRGLVGSISHTDQLAAAIVAQSPPSMGLGMDFEPDTPLDAVSVPLVCRPEELLQGFALDHVLNLRRGKRLFVIKEALYKCLWPTEQVFFDFQDVSVTLDESAGTFRAKAVDANLRDAYPFDAMTGSFMVADGYIVALACC